MRVAVIGSGVVGACVGWHLARRGTDVVMIDGGEPGAGVSNWSFSWVNASNKTQTRAYFDLNVAGMSAYRELTTQLGSGRWWHPTGHLRWAEDPTAAEALRDAVDQLRSWGYDGAIWDAEKVRRLLEPDIRFPTADTEVAVYSDESWIDGRNLAALLVDGIVSMGNEVRIGNEVIDIVVEGDRVTDVVMVDGHQLKVDAVVNAAGPAGREVAGLAGRTLPMRDEPGLVARIRCNRVPIQRAMHAPHVELRPDGDDRVVLHSREIDALIDQNNDPSDPTDLTERLRRLAIDVAPALSGTEVIGARVSWRPIPIDGFPSVGAIDGVAGYYEAVTHSGITLGAVLGRCLAQEIVDGNVDDLVALYRPDRFVGVGSATCRE